MALIPCNQCGAQVSPKAKVCPKCGAPNPADPQKVKCQDCENLVIPSQDGGCPVCGNPNINQSDIVQKIINTEILVGNQVAEQKSPNTETLRGNQAREALDSFVRTESEAVKIESEAVKTKTKKRLLYTISMSLLFVIYQLTVSAVIPDDTKSGNFADFTGEITALIIFLLVVCILAIMASIISSYVVSAISKEAKDVVFFDVLIFSLPFPVVYLLRWIPGMFLGFLLAPYIFKYKLLWHTLEFVYSCYVIYAISDDLPL